MTNYQTEQELFWAGKFGDEYVSRNNDEKLLCSNITFFSKVLSSTFGVKSILEFGSNVGLNLKAINCLFPEVELSAIEINANAAQQLKVWGKIKKIYAQSILDFAIDYPRDFVFTNGVLIHINPEYLVAVYNKLYESSNKYILIAEYYNPIPQSIVYRGHVDKLFKRDFAGEMLDKYPGLTLVNYGFVYHRDANFPQDDMNWFLLQK